MSAFGNLTTDGLERQEDSLGSGRQVFPSDIYDMKIKYAYSGKSSGGAMSVTVVGELTSANNAEYQETFYITNKQGQNFFEQNGKKLPLPGFTIINDLCLFGTSKPLAQQSTEDKIIEKYDPEVKGMTQVSVPVITALTNQTVSVAIRQIKDYKRKKFDSGYKTVNETVEFNGIEKVFNKDNHRTSNEVIEHKDATFYNSWLKKRKNDIKDKTKGKLPEVNESGDSMPKAEAVPKVNPFA